MKEKRAKDIRAIFDQVEEEFPDKSTEFLMEITCQRARGMDLDHGDVAEALQQTSRAK